jgi:threonine dehydrogenase-like Zn-dependent dehydrogenase
MRQLTFLAPGHFEWRDVPVPVVSDPRHAVVKPLAVARCDLDLYIANGYIPAPGPFAFGHEAIAEVVEVGEAVAASGFKPGDRVSVPFQISCGHCGHCRRGLTGSCEAVRPMAAYGLARGGVGDFGGALSDFMHVPFADHMLVPLPPGVDPVSAASVCDNVADGWRAVAPHLQARPGASVLVVGGLAQSVGLFASGSAVALGAGRTLYLDDNADNRARAQSMGAYSEPLTLEPARRASEQFEIVVEAAGTTAGLDFAIRSCAPNGYLTSVSIHLAATTPLPLTAAYYKGLTLHTGRAHTRPFMSEILSCIACGKLHPDRVTHRVASFDQAPEAMTDPGPKVIFVP